MSGVAGTALVLFSGGQDSTTCLAWALERYARVETVSFDYGQRHAIELAQRLVVLARLRREFPHWAGRLGDDHLLALPTIKTLGATAMTDAITIEMTASGLPNTFVPGRNLLFLTYSAALGYRRGITTLVGGMCETDFSGYPDCRNDTLQTLAKALSLGMDREFTIETPLMWLDKSETWALAHQLGGDRLVNLIVEDTHTCYLGERGTRQAWGHGCGTCPSCDLRAKGWAKWQSRTT